MNFNMNFGGMQQMGGMMGGGMFSIMQAEAVLENYYMSNMAGNTQQAAALIVRNCDQL